MEEARLQSMLRMAEDHLAHGNTSHAVELLRNALSIDPDHAGAHAVLAIALIQQKRIHAALAEAQMALTLEPENPYSHAALGKALFANRKLSLAEKHLDQALALAPDDPGILRMRAVLYR